MLRFAESIGCALLVSIAAVAAPSRGSDATENSCITCHAALPDALGAPVEGMQHDIHAEHGLSCADCHGGDPTTMDAEAAMSPDKGYRGAPEREAIPSFCGRCHADGAYMRRFNPRLPTDQLQQYWTSVHGQRLKRGDVKVATCVSCHGVHGILPADRAQASIFPANVPDTCGHCHSNPQYMAEYKIPTDQEETFKRSVHAERLLVKRDFSAPACNSCHGNHGAFPPGVNSIAEVCGQCHANSAMFFTKSPHKPAFDRLGLPECVTCHSNHEILHATDNMLGGQHGTVCRRCHEVDSPGYIGAVKMRDAIDRLTAVMTDTESMLTKAAAMGMEVSEEQYTYREEVYPQLIKVRSDTHRADPAAVLQAVEDGITSAEASKHSARSTLDEARARRRHLLIPLALVILLMALIYAKLRQLEAHKPPET